MMSYWKRVGERLIKRGMLIMDLDFLRGYRDELIRMNRRKRGRPYRIAESRIVWLGEDLVGYNPRGVNDPVVIVLDSTGVKVWFMA